MTTKYKIYKDVSGLVVFFFTGGNGNHMLSVWNDGSIRFTWDATTSGFTDFENVTPDDVPFRVLKLAKALTKYINDVATEGTQYETW